MSGVVVRVEGLAKNFGSVIAVDRVSLDIPSGIVYGFLGPNGAGKTTLLKMISGTLGPDHGTGTVLGHDIFTDQDLIRRDLGYMSQKVSLYDELSAADNLRFFGSIYGLNADEIDKRQRELSDQLSLGGQWHNRISDLSRGARQRVAFACAVAHRPSLLLLDEPSAGMDPVSRIDFWDILYDEAVSGTTLIVTTHFMDEAEHCDRLCLMNQGRIVAEGEPSFLRDQLSGRTWEVDVDLPAEALDVLDPLFSVGLHGASLRVIVAAHQSAKDITDALTNAGMTRIYLKPVAPTLEEVFVGHLEGAV